MVWLSVEFFEKTGSNFIFAMQDIDVAQLFDRVKLVISWCIKDKFKDFNYGLNQYGYITRMY